MNERLNRHSAASERAVTHRGNIRNIALSAAYLAASEGQPIRMAHLRSAAEGEYKKIGKLPGGSIHDRC